MSDYKCGHDRKMVIISSNVLSLLHYVEWRDEQVDSGLMELCSMCWNKKQGYWKEKKEEERK
jgi:hypothetical protein